VHSELDLLVFRVGQAGSGLSLPVDEAGRLH
jgi:hypothetical protein